MQESLREQLQRWAGHLSRLVIIFMMGCVGLYALSFITEFVLSHILPLSLTTLGASYVIGGACGVSIGIAYFYSSFAKQVYRLFAIWLPVGTTLMVITSSVTNNPPNNSIISWLITLGWIILSLIIPVEKCRRLERILFAG
jgi:hypothetical protein